VLIIVPDNADPLMTHLHSSGYGFTTVEGVGANSPVKLIYTIVQRRNLEAGLTIIHQTHPHACLSIQDVRSTQEGIFPVLVTMPGSTLFTVKRL
jgi:Uncharacterized protein conserved in bacteria (DUF2179)